MTEPYATVGSVRLYHADCRDILPKLHADTVVTDPVWPGAEAELEGRSDPERLLRSALQQVTPDAVRLAVQLGCDTDPRFLDAVPEWWDFFRVAWLSYAKPGYKGRLLQGADVAYLFGEPPSSRDGQHLIPGEVKENGAQGKERDHPTPSQAPPRRMAHQVVVRAGRQDRRSFCREWDNGPRCDAVGPGVRLNRDQGEALRDGRPRLGARSKTANPCLCLSKL